MKKVKKIKKIPKYYNGELAVKADPAAGLKIKTPSLPTGGGINAGGIAGAVGGAASSIAGALGIEQGKTGQVIGAVGDVVGKINPIAGAAVKVIGATAGASASLDTSKISTTSDINDAVSHNSGWVGALFGADRDQLLRDANQWQNSMVATEMTENLRADWANDPRNQQVVSTLKEGGLVPGEHYASRGEVEVDQNGNNAVRYAWDPKGKDTYHIYANPDGTTTEGNMIFNDEGVKRPNGMKYSDTADKIIKGVKDPKLRKISLKKLAAEQEIEKAKEGKTKGGVPAYDVGIHNVKSADDLNWYNDIYSNKNTPTDWFASTLGMIDSGNFEDYNNLQNAYATLGFTDTKPGATIHKSKEVSDYQGLFDNMTDINGIIGSLYGTGRLSGLGGSSDRADVWRDGLPGSATWLRHLGRNVDEKTLAEMNVNLNKRGVEAFINPDNGMVNYRHHIANPQFMPTSEAVRKSVFGESKLKKVTADKNAAANSKQASSTSQQQSRNNSNWENFAYKAASILTPLLDREKAEKTLYQVPTAKYMPTTVDITPQIRAINDSMAMARYNQANINPRTGAGMAYGLQAASNRAKQLADAYTYQTNAQNELIGKNVGIYNNWSQNYANIMNKVHDSDAANRAAARNINRQNRATALSNWGKILKNERQFAMDDVRMAALEPLLQYAYENPEQIKKLVNQAKGK